MDSIDYHILQCLRENARMGASSMSKRVNLSVSAVLERIRKMEQSGLICGYTVLTDIKAHGVGLIALIEVRLEHPKYYEAFSQMVEETPEIVSCFYTTGDYDFLMQVYAEDADDLERLHRKVKSVGGVGQTRTNVVLKRLKDEPVYFRPQPDGERK